MKISGVILCILLISATTVYAQQEHAVDYFHDEYGNSYHQLYLDFQADELIELKYANDESGTKLEGDLSADGYSVIIKNYHGTKPVSVKVKLADGKTEEVLRSKCHIDPVILVL
jgi:hypothetical protein